MTADNSNTDNDGTNDDHIKQHVYIYMQILHINCIDSENESLSAKFYFRATWVQDKPDYEGWEQKLNNFDGTKFPKGINNPKLSFDNVTDVMELKDQSLGISQFREAKNNDDNSKIVVEWKARGSGTFIQSLSFKLYPFDTQELKINMASMNPTVKLHDDCYDQVKSTMRKDYFVDTGFVPIEIVKENNKEKIQEINGHCESTNIGNQSEKEKARGSFLLSLEDSFVINHLNPQEKQFHLLSYIVPVRRISRHAITDMFTPVFLITTAAFTAYGVPPQDVKARLGTSVTLALVITAYKYLAATKHIPILPDHTICDDYMLAAFIIVFLIVFQNWLAGRLTCQGFCNGEDDSKPSERGEKFDEISIYILGILWVVWNIYTVGRVLWTKRNDTKSFVKRRGERYAKIENDILYGKNEEHVPFYKKEAQGET